jgi:hypothetical protein
MKHFPTMAYSVFIENDQYAPLDSIAFKGKCYFIIEANKFFGGDDSESYVSDVFESPNWGQVFIESMKAQQFTLNFHHCYLEGLNVVSVYGDVTFLSFSLGS